MLVLSRRKCESLTIFTTDGEIIIRIENIDNGQVRMSFDLPEVSTVQRELGELYLTTITGLTFHIGS